MERDERFAYPAVRKGKKVVDRAHCSSEDEIRHPKALQALFCAAALTACFYVAACGTPRSFESEKRNERFEQSEKFFAQGKYEDAIKENQKVLSESGKEADAALFNMGVIFAYSDNPRKDYPKALSLFKQVVKDYPQSPKTQPAKAWIQVLEEHQRILEEKHKLAEEKRILTREKDTLAREKDVLSQEREKFKKIVEKSRQVDLEIEKRRRQARNK